MSRRIDVMIAGAQKAGTSTLADLVAHSAGVSTHHGLEFTYYVDPRRRARGLDHAWDRAFGPPRPGTLVLAKSAGVMFVPGAAVALAADHPGCRLVVVLRHPVDRLVSAYWFFRRTGAETATSLEDALAAEPARLAADPFGASLLAYRGRSDYLPQLESLRVTFGSDRLQVLLFDDLVRDPLAVAGRVTDWLGVAPPRVPRAEPVAAHNGAARPRSPRMARWLRDPPSPARAAVGLLPTGVRHRWRQRVLAANEVAWQPPAVDPSLRTRLCEEFRPGVEALAGFLDRDLSAWLA